MAFLISFDIDGTMEFGDPAGGVTVEMVRRAKELGFIVGSCSDRFPSWQKKVWDSHGIAVDFWVPKHMLSDVKARFQADRTLTSAMGRTSIASSPSKWGSISCGTKRPLLSLGSPG